MTDDALFPWSVVIPVKVLAHAKSRLAPLAGARRPALALAMAVDTVTAVAACPEVDQVIVVTDDRLAADRLAAVGATVIPDRPGGGLNAALVHGSRYAAHRRPGTGLAALSADLPALRAGELSAALWAAARWSEAFVPDQPGDGTTLYTTAPGALFRPRFGADSRRRHAAGGATELILPGIRGLRRDVDTPADLRDAARLGLGPATATLAAGLLAAAR